MLQLLLSHLSADQNCVFTNDSTKISITGFPNKALGYMYALGEGDFNNSILSFDSSNWGVSTPKFATFKLQNYFNQIQVTGKVNISQIYNIQGTLFTYDVANAIFSCINVNLSSVFLGSSGAALYFFQNKAINSTISDVLISI